MAVLVFLSGVTAAVAALPSQALAAAVATGATSTPTTTPACVYEAYKHPAVPNDVEMASKLRPPTVAGMESGLGASPRFAAEDGIDSIPGLKAGWQGRVADNGKGWVWQRPGATGNGDMMRVMDPTPQYPNGYVRFYNDGGQPLGLDGKPGSNSLTHIPRNPDGSWPVPKGWN